MYDSKNAPKVRQLTGQSQATIDKSQSSAFTADSLNKHYGRLSTDAEYIAPRSKCTANI